MRLLPPLAGLAAGTALLVGLGSCGEEGVLPPPPALTNTSEVALAKWRSFHKQQKDRIPQDRVTSPGEPWGEYVGSRACGACHAEEYAKWRKSFHSRTLYDAVDGTVMGDFTVGKIDVKAVVLEDGRRKETVAPYKAEVFSAPDDRGRTRYYMRLRETTEAEGWPPGRSRNTYGSGDSAYELPIVGKNSLQEVVWTFGNRRHQPYVARWRADPADTINDGAFWTLPFFYNDAEREWQYCGFRRYTDSCASCHTTGILTSSVMWRDNQPTVGYTQGDLYNLRPGHEGWSEGAVGCENCHGAGLEHVRQVDKLGVRAYTEQRRSGKKPPSIFSGGRSSGESLHRLTQMCDSCHNFFTESSLSFLPTPHGYGRDALHAPLDPRKDPYHIQHYPDGSKKSPCSIGTVYRQSKMYKAGIACFDCHDAHGSDHFGSLKKPIEDNSLCIECHVTLSEPAAQAEHSKHLAGSPGNRCVECHMPRHMVFTNGQQSMSDRIHNHILSVPVGGARTDQPPTSCNICHVDRDEAWTAAEIGRLWPHAAASGPDPGVKRPDGVEAAPPAPPVRAPPEIPGGPPPPSAIPGARDDRKPR